MLLVEMRCITDGISCMLENNANHRHDEVLLTYLNIM